MKVLFVSRAIHGQPGPFVRDQTRSLTALGVDVDFLSIQGAGVAPYLLHPRRLARRLDKGDVDIVHAVYGLSGLTTLFDRRVPLVMSFIGCDFNTWPQRTLAKATICRKASLCIFMNQAMRAKAGKRPRCTVLPFGVDMERFVPGERHAAQSRLGFDPHKRHVLFASAFDRPEKDPGLARQVMNKLDSDGVVLHEFHPRYTPDQVVDLYNACDALLLTSKREGSPQVVKEAMACGLPVVSTPVGDVPWLLEGACGGQVAAADAQTLADAVRGVLGRERSCEGRARLMALGLDLPSIASKLAGYYREVLSQARWR